MPYWPSSPFYPLLFQRARGLPLLYMRFWYLVSFPVFMSKASSKVLFLGQRSLQVKLWLFTSIVEIYEYSRFDRRNVFWESPSVYWLNTLMGIYCNLQHCLLVCFCLLDNIVLLLYITALFNTQVWNNVNSQLPGLFSDLTEVCLRGREHSTVKNYSLAFKNFSKWCDIYSFQSLPASETTVALYLVHVIHNHQACSRSKLNTILCH